MFLLHRVDSVSVKAWVLQYYLQQQTWLAKTMYFIMEHDKNVKRGIPLKIFLFSENISSGKWAIPFDCPPEQQGFPYKWKAAHFAGPRAGVNTVNLFRAYTQTSLNTESNAW